MKLQKSTSNFELAPAGTTQAVVVDVVDMGMLPGFNPDELVHKIQLVFQTEEETSEGVPFTVRTFGLNASLNSKSSLVKNFIKPILGRNLDPEDFDEDGDLDIDGLLIGKNANITIEHNEKGENTYANIVGVGTLTTKQQKEKPLEPRNYVRVQDRDTEPSYTGKSAAASI